MTTPSVTSPNVRLVAKEAPVPADDSNLRGPTPGEIQPAFVAEIFDSALKDEADHATALAIAGQDMVASARAKIHPPRQGTGKGTQSQPGKDAEALGDAVE